MKRILSVLLADILLCSSVTTTSHAQINASSFPRKESPELTTPKINGTLLKPQEVNIKAVRDFMKSFTKAEDINWYKAEGGFMVYFKQDGFKDMGAYDLNGNWIYNILSYPASNLPRTIRRQVKSTYYDCSVLWINEITMPDKLIYIVHMEDNESFINLRVCDDEMDIIEEYKKR
ncbi:MAG: hypothetical protein ABUT20_03050 [Bacteroidota bacterium]